MQFLMASFLVSWMFANEILQLKHIPQMLCLKKQTYSWVLNSFRQTSNRIPFVEKVHQVIRSTWCSCWLLEQKHMRSHILLHDIFPIWGNALLGILSYYENVCQVQPESSMLYKWPLWSHALVQVSRLSIDAIGSLLSSHKQAKIHQWD